MKKDDDVVTIHLPTEHLKYQDSNSVATSHSTIVVGKGGEFLGLECSVLFLVI